MKKFTLPISQNYVKHWGLWEAIREILQNAYDEKTVDPTCEVKFERDMDGKIRISTSTGLLSKASLVLGNSDKTDKPELRGKFGEGYKLALLVLARLGHPVSIFTGSEQWEPRIEHDDDFDSSILNIYVRDAGMDFPGVCFEIEGVSLGDWMAIQTNIDPTYDGTDKILRMEGQKGRIYVGGLFVTFQKEYQFGYSFTPATMPVDRDRRMVCDYSLAGATSRIWAGKESYSEIVQLVMKRAVDVRYLDYYIYGSTPLVSAIVNQFDKEHGIGTIPCSTDDEIKEAQAGGRKWVLVPEMLRKLIGKVRDLFVPKVGTPVERLKKLAGLISLSEVHRKELEDIIECLTPTEVKDENTDTN